ncbi:MAG: asparagine synthase (glutamine-hydrolyzing) [Nitrospiraceae bacterium]|nr:MAG: asparagine synthase (glutamine-hydrolyzing) [Nitrospiraceae bacterium]
MCGIAGIVSFSGEQVRPALLEQMRDRMSHRGPDDSGIFVSENRMVGLAHRRLTVIDLSEAGRQPMSNEDGTVWISFNGEIFNFPELKQTLIRQGHVFRSNCDTEVIIHLYEEHGTDCLEMLNGQFAFVIWDSVRNKVFGARDRLGIRPLYFSWIGQRFYFASELKALLPAVGKGDVDYSSVTDFLVLQYVPAPKTIFKHIRKLEAGTCLLIENGDFRIERYWEPRPMPWEGHSEDQIVSILDDLIHSSVQRQLISDVPLGVFLSGGVDSSAITAYMSSITDHTVKAYSVGFEEKEFDELSYAALAADYIPNVEHHKLILKEDRAFGLIQELIKAIDEPFADQAIIPTYLMSRYARESVTVCLSGEGSDEIFGGYDRYQNTIEKVKLMEDISRLSPELRPYIKDSFILPYEDYLANLCSCHLKELNTLILPDARTSEDYARTRFMDMYYGMDVSDDLQRIQRFDVATYLADNLLFKVDRASMLTSLEVRVPLLDHELVDFCLGLPFNMRYRSCIQKYILKKNMIGRIPNEIIFRQKMGFSVPIFTWFKDTYSVYLRDTLLGQKARERGIFRPGYVEALLDPKRMEIDKHNSLKLWCLLILEEWFRSYYD